MYVYSEIDGPTLLRIRRALNEGRIKLPKDQTGLPVFMGLQGEDGFPHRGTLDFFDNRANPSNGSVHGARRLPQPRAAGRPSADVARHVCAATSTRRCAAPGPIGPGSGPAGRSGVPLQDFLYLVDDQNKVVRRSVKWGQEHDGLTVVKQRLETGRPRHRRLDGGSPAGRHRESETGIYAEQPVGTRGTEVDSIPSTSPGSL